MERFDSQRPEASDSSPGAAFSNESRALPTWQSMRLRVSTAEDLLHAADIHEGPVDVLALAQLLDIRVEFVTDRSWDGAVECTSDHATIWLHAERLRERQRFTLAHELAHVMLHPFGVLYRDHIGKLPPFGPARRQEVEANRFAAALLMPAASFENALRSAGGDINTVAQAFDVSVEAATRRALELSGDHGVWGT